jgi:hypothetical protein
MAKRKTKKRTSGKTTVCFATRHGRVCFLARPKRRSR